MARSPPIKSTPGFSKAAPTARRWSRPRAAQNGNRFPLVLNLPECWQLKLRPRRLRVPGDSGCVRRGWDLLKKKFGLIFGGTAVFAAIQFGISLLGQIPVLGILISLGSIIIGGPLMGGLYHFFLKNIRGQTTEIADIFEGFRSHFVQLMLGYIVSLLITGVTAIPGAAILGFSFVPIVRTHQISPGAIALAVAGFVVVLVPAIFLTVTWLFSLPLIIDKRLDFWTGMETSRKVVWKHWWQVFALVLVCGLVNLGGALACCIGALVTMPITFGAMMYAYEDLFGTRPAQAA